MHVNGLPIKPGSGALPYFDDSMNNRILGFFGDLQEKGVPILMTDGFRNDDMQSVLQGNQYGGAAPGTSLHQAGFAFDINWKALTSDERALVLTTASNYGLSWGGGFKPTDLVHFFMTPVGGGVGQVGRSAYINNAQAQYIDLLSEEKHH